MPFNYEEYQQKCNTLSTEQLQKEWENYTRQIAGGATSTATSVLFSPLTAGVSLVGLGLSAPRIHNARKKREIIERSLQAQGATHNTRGRDVAGSVAVSGVIAGLTLGLASPGADIIAGEAVGKGVEYAAAHVVLEGAGAAVEHKHDGHLKKKGETQLQQKQMQSQYSQYQGYQQQYVPGQGIQYQSIQGVQMQMGAPQQPPLTHAMPLPQPGILMQNQRQIQWQQQQNGLQIPGAQQPHMIAPGLAPMQVPPRPHSAAPDNQYQQYQAPPAPQFVQQAVPQQQYFPQYQQTQQSENFHLVTIPSQPQQPVQTYPPEKTPAYTTSEHMPGDVTPLPLYSQQTPLAHSETERAVPPSHIDLPEGPTMEEEIAILKARLLQMELEKRGMSATISSPCEISLDGPDATTEKVVGIQPAVQAEVSKAVTQPTMQPDQGPSQLAVQKEQIQNGVSPSASPLPLAVSLQQEAQPQALAQSAETQTQQHSSPAIKPPQHLPQPQTQDILVPAPVAQTNPHVQDQLQPPTTQQPHIQDNLVPAPLAQAQGQAEHQTSPAAHQLQIEDSLVPAPLAQGQPQSQVQPPTAPPAAQFQAPQMQTGQYPVQQQLSKELTQSSPALVYAPTPIQPPQPPQQQAPQQNHAPPPSQPQQAQRQNSVSAPPPQVSGPATPALSQQQYQTPPTPFQTAPIFQPQPITPQVQQQAAPAQVPQQYAPSPQQYYPPAQVQRQDSGYYSQAPTPFYRPVSIVSSISSISSTSSPDSRHNSVSSYTPGTPAQTQQPYNPQQQQPPQQFYNPAQQPQQGIYNPASHARSPSIASPPPPYFAPPPTGPQPILAGKTPDYFNQGVAPPLHQHQQQQQQHPSFPNYAQIGVGGQRGSIVGGQAPVQYQAQGQGWQWGTGNPQQQFPQQYPQQPPPQPMPMQVGGGTGKMMMSEPNYGPPPAVPGVWRSS